VFFPKPQAINKRKAAKRKSKEEFWSHPNVIAARNSPCVCCGRKPPSDPHHLLSRGANRGADWLNAVWNLAPLCRDHHSWGPVNVHRHGIYILSETFPQFRFWLLKNGWEFDPTTKQWSHR